MLGFFLPSVLTAAELDFQRDIWPILESRCVQCHGTDAEAEAGLRLTNPQQAFLRVDSGEFAIVPGNLQASTLWQRISSNGDDRMPPEGETAREEPAVTSAGVGSSKVQHGRQRRPRFIGPINDFKAYLLRRIRWGGRGIQSICSPLRECGGEG